MLTLYTTTLSANGRKTLAVARHLDLNLTEQHINVYAGEGNDPKYRSLNPWGKIPTLVDEDFVLWESNAILVYLSECHGNFLLSSNKMRQRATILKWLFWESSHWQPTLHRVLAARVAQILFPKPNENIIRAVWEDHELMNLLSVLESVLTSSHFICGATLTIADYSVAGMTTYFYACEFPFSKYPAISAWLERISKLPAWISTEEVLWSEGPLHKK